MKNWCALFILFFSNTLLAQEFSMVLRFTDAKGYMDSVIVGYDVSATDGIDTTFGEVNIINTSVNPNLDVRITNEYVRRLYGLEGTWHTKKNIQKNKCPEGFPPQYIDIQTKNWPVNVKTSRGFESNQECPEEVLFASWYTFDVIAPSNLGMVSLSKVTDTTFSANCQGKLGCFGHIKNNNDTVSTYWIDFRTKIVRDITTNKTGTIRPKWLVPNPTSNFIEVPIPDEPSEVLSVRFLDALGNPIPVQNIENTVYDVSHLPAGIYTVVVTTKHFSQIQKFIKQ